MKNFFELGSKEPLDPLRFSTSWLLPPSVLFFLRALFSLYIFVSIFTILGIDAEDDPSEARHYFSYFTSLTFWGLAFYFLFASIHTGSYWLSGRPLLARWPKALQILHSMYYSTVTTFPYLVTIVYWGLIYDYFSNDFDVWRNVSQHALNTVFAIFELVVPRTSPTPFIHLVVLIVILALYLGLAYLTWDTEHFYVYDFLDSRIHSHGVIAGYIIGILVVAMVAFVIVHYLILLRQWITEKKLHKTGIFTTRGRGAGGADAEMGEVRAK